LKRSEYIAIGAVGLLLVATFWPRGSDAPPPNDPALDAGRNDGFQTLAFASLAECKDSQAVTAAVCETEYAKASQSTVEDAPKYSALSDCEAEYGANQCRPATWNGASVFIPAMAGMLLARSLTGGLAQSQPLYPPRTGPQSCPPGAGIAERPECQTRTASSSGSSSSSGGAGGRSYYSTGSGRTIGRVAGAVIADMVLPSRTTVSRTATLPRGGSWGNVPQTRPSTTTSSYSRSPSGSWSSSSSSTTSRGGFGTTARSSSSFGS
jgi:uncharacterized protein YgiB involved in biofilm formation